MKLALRLALIAAAIVLLWLTISRTPPASTVAPVALIPLSSGAAIEPASADVLSPKEPSRVAVAAAGHGDAAAEQNRSTTALLRVHVFARETLSPLEGKRLVAHRGNAAGWSLNDVKGSHAGVGEAASTDSNGRAELEVESGCELVLDHDDHFDRDPIAVASLAPGEQRDVELDLPTQADLTFLGRLVDADTDQAISDGVLWFDEEHLDAFMGLGGSRPTRRGDGHALSDEIHANVDGTFELKGRSWEQKAVSASARGYSRAVFFMEQGHEHADRALEVRLSRTATLEVSVLDGVLAAQNAVVELTTESYRLEQERNVMRFHFAHDLLWSAKTDRSGRATLVDLPPRIPLKLGVSIAGNAPRREGDPITLEPGASKRIEIRLGSGAAIVGRIEDGAGERIAGCEIWRVTADSSGPRLLENYNHPAATTRADEQGRFRFDDVTAGSWLIGPAPQTQQRSQPVDRNAIAALAQLVQIEVNSRVVEVIVRVDRGLYVSGTVFDSKGAAANGTSMSARSASGGISLNTNTNDLGAFMFGPMPAGAYVLEAGNFSGPDAMSDEVRVAAGDSGLTVHLRPGGAICGRVVDSSGKLRQCELSITRDGQQGGLGTATADGSFSFKGLLVGSYNLNARTNDGFLARRTGLLVRAGETLDGIEILVEPGAKLKLRYDGEERYRKFTVKFGGALWTVDGIERGHPKDVFIPAGEIEFCWLDREPRVSRVQRLTLAAGQEREVVWDGK